MSDIYFFTNNHVIFQISSLSWPACQIANRKLHVSCSNRAAEISSILEDRILGAAPKVENTYAMW